MIDPPFPQSAALSKHRLTPQPNRSQPSPRQKPPASAKSSDEAINYIPGEPSIDLNETVVHSFLSSELSTPLLDELYDNLWLVARKYGKSVDPLHRQKVKAREIVVTEDVKLHLVWHYNKIYIKPMPLCLLNHDFWDMYLSLPADSTSSNQGASAIPAPPALSFDRTIALGFIRSYALLVRHRVDFMLARESHLFPADLDWVEWSEFIAHFRALEDEDVAKRFHYGQLRLSRLNWAVRLFRPSHAATWWFYEIPHWSTAMYLKQAVGPLLFGFASLSLVLSSMQVLVSISGEGLGFHHVGASSLEDMRRAFWVFSVMMLLLSGLVWVLLMAIPCTVLIWQLAWGFKNRGKPKPKTPE
ncbi:uncharacterized protein EI97DRAFT_388375 [Westerdykella ornata]|uniref:Uncharacterized protein n=1 Tax=Westerdykella ornata TaxID=318751 RepID=A0A6A6J4X1_WESOR|nr:uncharacterized protein EI97DRAFT_388375 [Westerdykella ornata]KAF2271227.1 hypothetical protein EI97DRAFT_388375 [Westerdykella ornata]